MKKDYKTIVSAFIISLGLFLGMYFLALSNRYEKLDSRMMVDKWTKKIYIINVSGKMVPLKK